MTRSNVPLGTAAALGSARLELGLCVGYNSTYGIIQRLCVGRLLVVERTSQPEQRVKRSPWHGRHQRNRIAGAVIEVPVPLRQVGLAVARAHVGVASAARSARALDLPAEKVYF
jgi:hypothetical protein